MKRAVAINGSPHNGGIVSQALDTACDAARRAGFTVERFDLFDMHIAPCRGCMRCRPEAGCALPEDDAHRLCEAIRRADLIVIATPTYSKRLSTASLRLSWASRPQAYRSRALKAAAR